MNFKLLLLFTINPGHAKEFRTLCLASSVLDGEIDERIKQLPNGEKLIIIIAFFIIYILEIIYPQTDDGYYDIQTMYFSELQSVVFLTDGLSGSEYCCVIMKFVGSQLRRLLLYGNAERQQLCLLLG